ncbi:unnamed protein product [Closterium sp. Naga37s-1]|nr:unnamed protein product [Closterium sp. Naga37s-1]
MMHVKSLSHLCSSTEVGKGMLCPAIHIWRSYGVQVAKGEVFGRIDVFRSMQARVDGMSVTATYRFVNPFHPFTLPVSLPSSSTLQGEVFGRIDVFRSMQARVDGMSVTAIYRFVNPFHPFTLPVSLPSSSTLQGEVFGRIDVFRSMQARVDGMSVTATYRFVNSPGVIRIGESGYGPELVRANIVISNNEAYGVDTPIVMHLGAVGVTVINNFIHDFGFAGIRCGADVHYAGDCMLTNISNNIVYNWRRNSSGDVDSAGIYYCTHWFSPGNVAECNYIAGGDHCYYLDYVTSGVVIRGGACINTYDGIKVNNGKLNVIKHVILKNVVGIPGWCTCFTPTINNCRKDPGTFWENMRLKYYDTELFRRLWPWDSAPMGRKGGGSVKVGKGGKAAKSRGGSGGRNGEEGGEGAKKNGTEETSNTDAGAKDGKGKKGRGNVKGRKGKEGRGTYKGGGGGVWEQLRALGLCIREVSADGNCFFRAVSDHVFGKQSQHVELRQQVVDYIESHEADFAPFVEDDMGFKEYCSSMREDGTWGGHMELQAVSLLLKRNACIHQLQQPRWNIVNFDDASTPTIHLSYHDGDHYNSVRMEGDVGSTPAQSITIQSGSGKSQASQAGASAPATPVSAAAASSVDEGAVKLVISSTGCHDRQTIIQTLDDLAGDVDAAIEYLIAVLANETTPRGDSQHAAPFSSSSVSPAPVQAETPATAAAGSLDTASIASASTVALLPTATAPSETAPPLDTATLITSKPLATLEAAALPGRAVPSAECSEHQQIVPAAHAAAAAVEVNAAAVGNGCGYMQASSAAVPADAPAADASVTGALAGSVPPASVKASASRPSHSVAIPLPKVAPSL